MLGEENIAREYYENSCWSVFEKLLAGVICTFLVWYLQWHWSRRRLYKLAAKIHGPTPLPFIGNSLQFLGTPKYTYKSLMKLFSDYPVVGKIWFGNRLFIGIQDPAEIEIFLNDPKSLTKDPSYVYAEKAMGHSLFTAPVPKWKKHRKIISPTFNQKILNNFVGVFAENSAILVEQLKKHLGKGEVDIFHHITSCSLDIICETTMGISVNAQTTHSDFGQWASTILKIMFLRMVNVLYHFDFIFNLSKLHREEEETVKKMHDFTDRVIREKQAEFEKKLKEIKSNPQYYVEGPNKRKALLELLIELSHEGANFTNDDLRDEVTTFAIAGTDTTASSTCFAFVTLGMHPQIQHKVYEEVLDVLGPDKPIEPEDLPKLKYTERVIKETLRLFPVGAIVPRYIQEDVKLNSCTLPANSSVVIGIHSVHKNPKYWPNPNVFDPDRFLPEEIANRHPYSYLPFFGGSRNCIGQRYAMMEMKCLLSSVVRKYKINTAYKRIEDVEVKLHFVMRPCDGYKVSFELRE